MDKIVCAITVKGYRVDIHMNDGYYYTKAYDNNYCFNVGNYIVHRDNDGKYLKSIVDLFSRKLSEVFISEEDILSPCDTREKYNERMFFLTHVYHNPEEEYGNKPCRNIYDFVTNEHTTKDRQEFVNRHIWLYMQLMKRYKPTLFPFYPDTGKHTQVTKFLTYLSCLPHIEPDDSMMQEVMGYLAKNASTASRNLYEIGRTDAVLQLIDMGFVKKPTMRKLLDMANENEDAQFVAIILDKLKDKTTKDRTAKFSL